jgi:hypothetical protein
VVTREPLADVIKRLEVFADDSSVDLARIAAAAAMADLFANWRDAIHPEVGDPRFSTRDMLNDIQDTIVALREYAAEIDPSFYKRLKIVV